MVSRRAATTTAALLVALIVAGCGALADFGKPRGGPYPDACAQWSYSARRCEAIVDMARERAQVAEADVRAITLLPFDRQVNLGGGQVALVRFELANGAVVDQEAWCVGVSMGRACNEVAEIGVSGGLDRDVPCDGEPPAGCATQPPTPDPDAIAAAKGLTVGALDIPLDHEGPYEVEVGAATLPNGYLSARSATLAESRPDTFWIDDGVRLEVRPDLPGRPPVGSIYRDPFDGLEPVTVFLVFDVTDLDAPSILQVRDIVVR